MLAIKYVQIEVRTMNQSQDLGIFGITVILFVISDGDLEVVPADDDVENDIDDRPDDDGNEILCLYLAEKDA